MDGRALRLGEGFELAVVVAAVLAGVFGGGGGGVGGGASGVERCDGAVAVLLLEVGGGDARGERAGGGSGGSVTSKADLSKCLSAGKQYRYTLNPTNPSNLYDRIRFALFVPPRQGDERPQLHSTHLLSPTTNTTTPPHGISSHEPCDVPLPAAITLTHASL